MTGGTSSPILDMIEAGHVATGLTGSGEPTPAARCRLDGEQWPCEEVRAARANGPRP